MKWLRRFFYLLTFFLGFVLASHWDGGRIFVQEISPAYEDSIKKSAQQLSRSVEKGMKKTIKDLKKNIK